MNEAKYNPQADKVWQTVEWIASELTNMAELNNSEFGNYIEERETFEIPAKKIWTIIDGLLDAKEILERMGANSPYV